LVDAGQAIVDAPQNFRDWHDGYQPESFGGHLLDGVATVGVGLLDIGVFVGNVAKTGANLTAGAVVDDIEFLTGADLPDWLPSRQAGVESLQSAGEIIQNIVENPKLIWDSLSEPYAKLWAEDRYGGLVGQVVADFGDILLGSKGAGKTAGALSDLAKTGRLSNLDTLTDVLTAARRADTAAPGEFANIADELVGLKRADGSVNQVVEAARASGTLDELLDLGLLDNAEVDQLVQSGALSVDEAVAAYGRIGVSVVNDTVGTNSAKWTLDAEGRPLSVEARLTDTYDTPRSSAEATAQRNTGGDARLATDDGGHIIGHRFMSDQGPKNLFPQDANLNRSAYKKMENEWADWTAQGFEVQVRVELHPPGSSRPTDILASYEVIDPATGDVVFDRDVEFANIAGESFDRVSRSDMASFRD
jgi:hypothetical protein